MSISVKRLYEKDYLIWLENTAYLLRQHRFDEVDIDHLVEEIEDIGRSEKRAVRSQLTRLLMHWLKWQYQTYFLKKPGVSRCGNLGQRERTIFSEGRLAFQCFLGNEYTQSGNQVFATDSIFEIFPERNP